MKKLITILIALIPLMGMGQDPWKYFPEEDSAKANTDNFVILDDIGDGMFTDLLPESCNNNPEVSSAIIITSESFDSYLLKTLKEYQKYCESDSALFEIDYWIYPVDTATDVIKYKRTDLDEYIEKHKFKKCECYDDSNYQVYLKPQMTLEGFIEWLERRGRND